MNIKPVFLYSDSPSKSLNIDKIEQELSALNIDAQFKGNFFDSLNLNSKQKKQLFKEISETLIDDIEEEKLNLNKPSHIPKTNDKLLYDGLLYTRVINRYFLLESYNAGKAIHIVFTNKLLCTFENRRYHARVVLLGYPSFISTSGLVEAPARPREYYFLKAQFIAQGRDIRELDEYFSGRYAEYDDPKTTDILLSYVLQVIFYELTGEPFCKNNKCCLFNSHWQEDVLEVQYGGKLCEYHHNIIEKLS